MQTRQPRGPENQRGENPSSADSGQKPPALTPLPRPADADTDAGCLAVGGVSPLVSDTAARRCPPPDSDTERWATRPTLARPDSDARPSLSDSSLSQLHEPDPRVGTEDESRCKLALIVPVTPVAKSSFFSPTSITLREERAAHTQIKILKITQMKPQLVISLELNAVNVIRFVCGLLSPSLRSACGCHVCGSPSSLCSLHPQ